MIPERYRELLERLVCASREIFADSLTGVYLHGSAVMGCFDERVSDLDVIIVVETEPDNAQKAEFMRIVAVLNDQAPAKGIELSVVRREHCRPFCRNTPFDLHFSAAHIEWYRRDPEDYIARMNGTDIDLAAHFMIIRRYGETLFGRPTDEVFGEVPRECYVESIVCDIENAPEDVECEPVYITLNLCRVLAYLRDGLVLSKQAGGEWGLENVPEYADVIGEALRCRATGEKMTAADTRAQDFARYMLAAVNDAV